MKNKKKQKPRNEKPLSLHPMSFEEALKKMMGKKYDAKKEKEKE